MLVMHGTSLGHLFAIAVVAAAATVVHVRGSVVPEYCNGESFEARCPDGHVVFVTHARYGRMSLGRCVRSDLGYVGCYVDVLADVDRRCSGRQACAFRIPDLDLSTSDRLDCLEELKSYLEATFTCVKVEGHPNAPNCQPGGAVVPTSAQRGFLASLVTEASGCGGASFPWVLAARPGSSFNVTLHDFSVVRLPGEPAFSPICQAYATIREPGRDSRTVCGGHSRTTRIYTSVSNRLEIRVLPVIRRDDRFRRYFLLEYVVNERASQCPDPKLSSDTEWERQRDGTVRAVCKYDRSLLSILTCKDGEWNRQVDNCTRAHVPTGAVKIGNVTMSFEISMLVISIIAALISLTILVAGLVCLRRKMELRSAHRPPQLPKVYEVGADGVHVVRGESGAVIGKDGNEYVRIVDMPLPPPPPPPPEHSYEPRSGKRIEQLAYGGARRVSMRASATAAHDLGPHYFQIESRGGGEARSVDSAKYSE